jgi:hypothetical protein
MKNFDLWAVDGSRFYAKRCPECEYSNDGDECELCGADLTDVLEDFDDLAEMFFYEDILADLEEVNKDLLFHEITIESGYYSGLQLYVTLSHAADHAGFTENGPEYVDNESTRYYLDLCRSAAIRKYEAEQRKVNKILAKIGRAYGMDQLTVYARFSNGETWYTKAGA